MAPRFDRPFAIQQIISPAAVTLQLPRSMRIYLTFHVSRIKPVHQTLLSPPVSHPPPPRFINGGPAFAVRCLVHSGGHERGLQYLVDREGYGSSQPASPAVDPLVEGPSSSGGSLGPSDPPAAEMDFSDSDESMHPIAKSHTGCTIMVLWPSYSP